MSTVRRHISITEKGESTVALSLPEATELQEMRFCRVSPTGRPGEWRVSDVARVGTAVIGDLVLHIIPKTPILNLVYMASMGHRHITPSADVIEHDAERALPAALARAFLLELQRATRRGLVKGYREVEESAAAIRGRWDVARQISARPGLPLPLEIDYDDFTEDIPLNRVLHTAVRVLRAIEMPAASEALREQLEVRFLEVGTLPRGVGLPDVAITRLNEHISGALSLARLILDAMSWTHRAGAHRGGTFLVNVATIFESFVAARLHELVHRQSLRLTVQDRRWWLDGGRTVALRPDIVIADAVPLTVADTKYKVLTDGTGAPPSGDIYQMVAYSLALAVSTAHLIYVSGDVVSRVIEVPVAGVDIYIHAVRLSGSIDDLEDEMRELAARVVSAAQRSSSQPLA